MSRLKLLYALLGVALLGAILLRTPLGEVGERIAQVGWRGMAIVLALYLLDFAIDSYSWQLTVPSAPADLRWLYRFWKVRMVGEALNRTLPAAGLGGEPVKAVLLKRHYAIGYREGTASLVLARTINSVALVFFLAGGYALILRSPQMPTGFKAVAGAGLGAFAVGVALFYAIQRWRLTSLAGTRIARFRFARRLEEGLHHLVEIDRALVRFYTGHRLRFAIAVALAFVNWLCGVAEVWVAMIFLGHPVSLGDAWIVETFAQLVRMGSFFIPASLGAQEGAFFVVGSSLMGSPALGVAMGLVRRFRELVWIAWGFALGMLFSRRGGLEGETSAGGGV